MGSNLLLLEDADITSRLRPIRHRGKVRDVISFKCLLVIVVVVGIVSSYGS